MTNYMPDIWASDTYDALEFTRTINQLLGIPAYDHRRRWGWWHDRFCESCRRVNDTSIVPIGEGRTIRIPQVQSTTHAAFKPEPWVVKRHPGPLYRIHSPKYLKVHDRLCQLISWNVYMDGWHVLFASGESGFIPDEDLRLA